MLFYTILSTPEQLFPLIKEIYGKTYPPGTSVKSISTEYSIERSDTKELTSIRADVTVLIAEKDIYHFECESKKDEALSLKDNEIAALKAQIAKLSQI